MKKAERITLKEKCTRIILKHGCIIVEQLYEDNPFYVNFEAETKLGTLSVTLDMDNDGSKVFGLFCRFHDAKKAKTKFDHWKQNLHKFESPNFDLSTDIHLTELFNTINN